MLISSLQLLFGLLSLLLGAESLVRGSSALALRLGLTPLVIGLTVVAFGTSAPELAVSIQGALQGNGGLVMGNVIGSNIANIGLILGCVALITPIAVHRQALRFDIPVMLSASVIVFAIGLNGEILRLHGLLFLLSLLGYLIWSFYTARRDHKTEATYAVETPYPTTKPWLELLMIISGLFLLVLGARWLVQGAATIAETVGVSKAIIGLTIIAVGTSLPELATSLVAAYRKQTDMAIGNVVGSNIFNLLSILGITASIQPFQIRDIQITDWLVMLGLSFILLPLIGKSGKLQQSSGAVLLAFYCAYIAYLAFRI